MLYKRYTKECTIYNVMQKKSKHLRLEDFRKILSS